MTWPPKVPTGDPVELRYSAQSLAAAARSLEAAVGLSSSAGVPETEWYGPAATAHANAVTKHASLTATFAEAVGYASSAMNAYATELEEAQTIARRAVVLAEQVTVLTDMAQRLAGEISTNDRTSWADPRVGFHPTEAPMADGLLASVRWQQARTRVEAEGLGDLAQLLADTATTKAAATFTEIANGLAATATDSLADEVEKLITIAHHGFASLTSGSGGTGTRLSRDGSDTSSGDYRRQRSIDRYIGKTPPATAAQKSKMLQLYMGAAVLPRSAQSAYVETHVTPHPLINMYAGLAAPLVAGTGDTLFAIGCASQPETCPEDLAGASALDASAAAPVGTKLEWPVAASTAPEGAGSGWIRRVANSGQGVMWQAPGAVGNARSIRIMGPTERYPNGYVRFYNDHGQPIGLNGTPGRNADTHIPLDPDGTYPLPKGW